MLRPGLQPKGAAIMADTSRLAVVSVADDLHAHVLRKVLKDRHATDLAIIHSDRLAATGLLNWSADGTRLATLPDCDGRAVDLAALDLLWWRRPSGKGWNPNSSFLANVTDEAARDLIYNDCVAALNGLVQTEFAGAWVNHPEATRRAEMKFVQLRAAHQAGLSVPRTLISQNPDEIRAFCAGRRMIVKAIAGTVKTPLMAQDVTPDLLANDAALRLSPAIWQERIDGTEHLRVHVFGQRIVAAHLSCPELDWRVHLEKTTVTRTELDPALEASLRDVMSALDLRMGIFDLKIDPNGQVWWFEVNPQGQFLFIEGMSGLPLADTFAEFLVDEARRPMAKAA
jgi:glutathione synthase/RimK-type ligase-like ATP-grasp enzyme